MPPRPLNPTPREAVRQLVADRGPEAVVTGCVALLSGTYDDLALIGALGGGPASWTRTGTEPGPAYWNRVWGARALLYVWDAAATPTVLVATADEAWRVREMAWKVIARHRLEQALDRYAAAQDDPVPRVRSAAERAAVRIAG